MIPFLDEIKLKDAKILTDTEHTTGKNIKKRKNKSKNHEMHCEFEQKDCINPKQYTVKYKNQQKDLCFEHTIYHLTTIGGKFWGDINHPDKKTQNKVLFISPTLTELRSSLHAVYGNCIKFYKNPDNNNWILSIVKPKDSTNYTKKDPEYKLSFREIKVLENITLYHTVEENLLIALPGKKKVHRKYIEKKNKTLKGVKK